MLFIVLVVFQNCFQQKILHITPLILSTTLTVQVHSRPSPAVKTSSGVIAGPLLWNWERLGLGRFNSQLLRLLWRWTLWRIWKL